MNDLLTPRRLWAARVLAIAADFIQIVAMPAFGAGAFSPVNDVLDVSVALAMILLVGWHWAFLPAFLAELVPFVGLVPTWTAAVLIATRGRGHAAGPAAMSSRERDVIDIVPASPPAAKSVSPPAPPAARTPDDPAA